MRASCTSASHRGGGGAREHNSGDGLACGRPRWRACGASSGAAGTTSSGEQKQLRRRGRGSIDAGGGKSSGASALAPYGEGVRRGRGNRQRASRYYCRALAAGSGRPTMMRRGGRVAGEVRDGGNERRRTEGGVAGRRRWLHGSPKRGETAMLRQEVGDGGARRRRAAASGEWRLGCRAPAPLSIRVCVWRRG